MPTLPTLVQARRVAEAQVPDRRLRIRNAEEEVLVVLGGVLAKVRPVPDVRAWWPIARRSRDDGCRDGRNEGEDHDGNSGIYRQLDQPRADAPGLLYFILTSMVSF